MRDKSLLILIAAAVMLLFPSCESDKATTVATQESNIDKYISGTHAERDVYRIDGSNRIVLTYGVNDTLFVGDTAKLALEGYIFNTSPTTQFCIDTVSAVIGSGYLVSGLDNGLRGALLNEECYVIFSAKYGFYDKSVGIVPAMSALAYKVNVLNIGKANR